MFTRTEPDELELDNLLKYRAELQRFMGCIANEGGPTVNAKESFFLFRLSIDLNVLINRAQLGFNYEVMNVEFKTSLRDKHGSRLVVDIEILEGELANYFYKARNLNNLPDCYYLLIKYYPIIQEMKRIREKTGKITPDNPCPEAIARVKDPVPIPTHCDHCKKPEVRLVNNREIYNGKSFGSWPYAYLCGSCRSYVSVHPQTNIPMGYMAAAGTREARKNCKPYFVKMCKVGGLSKNQGYEALASGLKIDRKDCHFAMFSIAMCNRAKQVCIDFINSIED